MSRRRTEPRFSGPQQPQPMFRRGSNKGVLAHYRHQLRQQAIDRNAETTPEKRSGKRAAS